MNHGRRLSWSVSLALVMGASLDAAPVERFRVEDFGTMPDGTRVKLFTLRNCGGMSAKIISYGGILTDLQVPDRHGSATNVVLGAGDLQSYRQGFRAPAAIIGRVANRIAGARFALDGVEYKLPANDGTNHIHGVFDKVVWEGKELPPQDGRAALQLCYFSKDGEEGFPGNLQAKIVYTLNDQNELRLDYEAVSDKATPVNLTSHAYFNLAGHGDVLGHDLWLAARHYTPADASLIPTGVLASVADTPLDFTRLTRVGLRIDQLKPRPGGYDHNFVIDGGGESLVLAARLRDPASGRVMEVRTTEPGVQLYTGNHLKHAALCLETQHFPNSINQTNFPSTVLRPGKVFRSTTVLAFGAQ
jgi:aldose 1-epimerase